MLCCHWRRLSLPFYMFYVIFLYGIIYWISKNIPLEIVGGGAKMV